jgi:hypothetical protein
MKMMIAMKPLTGPKTVRMSLGEDAAFREGREDSLMIAAKEFSGFREFRAGQNRRSSRSLRILRIAFSCRRNASCQGNFADDEAGVSQLPVLHRPPACF